MSQRVEERVTEKREMVVVETTCDICKRTIKDDGCDIAEVEVCLRTGKSYPESRGGEILEYDICMSCFRSELMPFMESKGAEPRERIWGD
jgi:hypothetical protein